MKIPFPTTFAILSLSVFLAGCGETPRATTEDANPDRVPQVYCSNYPLYYFAERIGGDFVDVKFPAPTEGDPAFWKPSEKDLITMQSADLVITNGATYEKWLETVSLPESGIVDTSKPFKGDYIASETSVTHTHGNGDSHSHAGTEFTTWMDFQQAIWQAEEIRDSLIRLSPENAATIGKNLELLAIELETLHLACKEVGAAIGAQPLVASHPVYAYFSRRYNLNVKSVLWEPETVPHEVALDELKTLLADHPAKWMIWEGEPVDESIAILKELGVGSVVVNPCGNRPESGDFMSVMEQNLANLKEISR